MEEEFVNNEFKDEKVVLFNKNKQLNVCMDLVGKTWCEMSNPLRGEYSSRRTFTAKLQEVLKAEIKSDSTTSFARRNLPKEVLPKPSLPSTFPAVFIAWFHCHVK
jgi:hypothetical protein